MKYQQRSLEETTREHLELLIDILKEELKDTIKALEDYVANGVINYEHLWTIFAPGSVIVSEAHGTPSGYEFTKGAYVKLQCGKAYALTCSMIDWGGKSWGRRKVHINVMQFTGLKAIKDLEGLPFSFLPEKDQLRPALIERGKKFAGLAGFQYKAYNGPAIGWDSEGEEVRVDVRLIPFRHAGTLAG